MGDISVMARRLEDRKNIQYGWSGNGGYYSNTGARLLTWYDDPQLVDYLFGLGQLALIGKPGSEKGGEAMIYSHHPDGTPHWVDKSERFMFSQIAFVDYGYLYDADDTWYYIIPGPMRIKIPLVYIDEHLDERGYEFETRDKIEKELAAYMFGDYAKKDSELQALIASYDLTPSAFKDILLRNDSPMHCMFSTYRRVYEYFDDWVVVKIDDDDDIAGFLVRPKQASDNRIETIDWN